MEEDRTSFLKQQAEKKKAYRAKLKLKQHPTSQVEGGGGVKELSAVFKTMDTRNEKALSAITIANYTVKLNRISKMMTGHEYQNSKFLHDPDAVIKHITECSLKSKKDYISPIIRILRHEATPPHPHEEMIERYRKFMTAEKSSEDKQRGDNILSKKDKENSLPLLIIDEQ